MELANLWEDGQGSSRGAVRGSMVVAAETAYAEGKAGNETMCRAQLWSVIGPMVKLDSEACFSDTGAGSGIGCSC